MNLIVVESPTKARTLSRFLGKDYVIEATMGHIKDLPKSKLGVDVEKNFKPDYLVVKSKDKSIKEIKERALKSKIIYLATDPDREGEAIAKHVEEVLHLNGQFSISKDRFRRIVFHEITKEAVEEAIKNPMKVNNDLVNAQIARRVLDRLVGYKLSPLLWKKVRRGLSAGRVQTVTVRLIVEREREIEAFKPQEYWEIFVELARQSKRVKEQESKRFIVKLIKIDSKKADINNKKDADKVVSDLKMSDYKVADVVKREVRKNPYPPFTTSTMTQSAARFFRWSAKRTMSIAQRLYEEGLITYHRTDSTNLSESSLKSVRAFIESKFGKNYLPDTPRYYKTKSKVAQEAHEAIRPTNVRVQSPVTLRAIGSLSEPKAHSSRRQETGANHQSQDTRRLYELIWKRFVSCQMEASVYDETKIDVLALHKDEGKLINYFLRASGQIMKFDGWKAVWGGKINEDNPLPDVNKEEPLKLIKVDPQQKFTEPPPRFGEASLVRELEKLGIGRPSTYAPIISTIQVRNYVEKVEGKFHPTPIGNAVNDFLINNFPSVFEYSFTASMEEDLDNVANGSREWTTMMKEFYPPFEKKLDGIEENAKRVKIEVEKTGRKCPSCKTGDLVIRIGRFGKFVSCSRFPECTYREKYLEKIGVKCEECGKGDVIVKKTKTGRKFYGCSRYPKCNWASWRKPRTEGQEQLTT